MSNENTQTAAPVNKQEGQMGDWARYYDFVMALMTFGREKKLRQMTIKLSQLMPGDKVLEIGCGTGTLTLAAKEQVGASGEVTGIDIAPEMLDVASRKASRKGVDISFQEGSIASIPFQDNRFDAVLCSFMIFHMPEEVRRKGLTEIYRVLKSGGHLCIMDAAPLDDLVTVLKEDSFTEIEMEKTKFSFMDIRFLRVKAEKA